MQRSSNSWPAVLAVLALVGLAVGVHLAYKQRGLVIREANPTGSCTPQEEVVCTDVEHIERLVREEE